MDLKSYRVTATVEGGFSIIEVIVATLIISVVVMGSVEGALRSLRIFNNGVARENLEAVISDDSSWLRAYSKAWHCEVGPYESCKVRTQGLSSAVNYRPEIFSSLSTSDYDQFKAWCQNRLVSNSTQTPAHQMLSDAAAISLAAAYAPPNTVQSNQLTLNLSKASTLAQKYKVYRTISVSNSGNSITVNYYTLASDNPYMKLNKSFQFFVEATAWCP